MMVQVSHDSTSISQNSTQGTQMTQPCYFIKDQYDQIIHMLNVAQTTVMANSASTSGIDIAFITDNSKNDWIIDIGATNHIVADLELLVNSNKIRV